MSLAQLEPYDAYEEALQLMDTDEANLQLEQQTIDTNTNVEKKQEEEEEEEQKKEEVPALVVIEKLKVYIRDGPDSHHVETIPVFDKYYELPTSEELTSIEITEEKLKDIYQSLNLTPEDFRTSKSPSGLSRPESLYVHGVNNMSTQEIFNYFEEFKPIGIEWISDHSCNIFWHDSLTPLQLLSTKTIPGPSISHRRPVNYDRAMRSSKRKASEMTEDENNSADIALPSGHWREGNFEIIDKPESNTKLYIRYTTVNDRKIRGAENQSEYYRQYGNPNYNNMTGLISRSKKRVLNAMRSNRFRDFTVVKSNDPSSTASSFVEEISSTTEDNSTDPNVKFTVVLPPKKDDEDDHRSKRQRRSSWNDNRNDDDDDDYDRKRKDKTHFTVTMDPVSKNDDDNDESTPVTDARQILERKRRQRK